MTIGTRCAQILRWMEHEWPCGRPVTLGWRKTLLDKGKPYDGETDRAGKGLRILLSRRECDRYKYAIDTLIHEYVHCIQWGMARVETHEKLRHHPPAFWAQYGEISDRFQHDHGAEESKAF